MESKLEHALKLARMGFHIFPIKENKKAPALFKNWPEIATNSADTITKWWTKFPNANIGISTTKYNGGTPIVGIDVDNKNDKKGSEEILKLELQGKYFPKTFSQKTPTGGEHLIYIADQKYKNGVDKLATGLDIRGSGGYLLGAGSTIDGIPYTAVYSPISPVPDWLKSNLVIAKKRAEKRKIDAEINEDLAVKRAIHYLENDAPISVKGEGGDQTAFKVAARLKDIGVDEVTALDLMLNHWNDRCPPGWAPDRLQIKIKNAYQYGLSPQGADAPEAVFTPIANPIGDNQNSALHPVEAFNKEFAFAVIGSKPMILRETTDPYGNFKLDYLTPEAFHLLTAPRTMIDGDGKLKKISRLWIDSPRRRSYEHVVFEPGKKVPANSYNLWRGFTETPYEDESEAPEIAKIALNDFISHARDNICQGDEKQFNWLIAYFAQMIQKPWKKPLTAVVMKGRKGVGKNFFVDGIAHLLGSHAFLASNKRYLFGRFNGHMERLILLTLDEAFWSGDKQSEGTLKDLITGKTHVIEQKGREAFTVKNCSRVVILGNEEWLVPASQDERRFAVFEVGEGRMQDTKFFSNCRKGMEAGGYKLLLQWLLDFDTSVADINVPPKTRSLLNQKLRSLDIFERWIFEMLHDDELKIQGADEGEVDFDDVVSAYKLYHKQNSARNYTPDIRIIGKKLKAILPSMDKKRLTRQGKRKWMCSVADIETLRTDFSKYMGQEVDWDE